MTPDCGMTEASTKDSPGGLGARTSAGATQYSAKPPFWRRLSPYTSSPGANAVTPSPTASTIPATSEPSTGRGGRHGPSTREYAGQPRSVSQSERLTEVARTRSSTSPGPGSGVGTSVTRSTSGPPYRS